MQNENINTHNGEIFGDGGRGHRGAIPDKILFIMENVCYNYKQIISFGSIQGENVGGVQMIREGAMDNSRGEENISVKKIDIRRGVCRPIVAYLVISFFVLLGACYIDIADECKAKLYHCVFQINKCIDKNITFYRDCRQIRDMLLADLDDYLSMILTLGTILAAAVVFFYSVQDSKKEGIPHRAIMSYTSGSLSVPILFVIAMLMLPLNYVAYSFSCHWFAVMGLTFTFITQMIIIVIILMSTSHQYSLHAICNAEIRQYGRLRAIRKVQDEKKDCVIHEKINQNPLFIWTYLLSHLEQVFLSDELISDKMEMARRLLRVPFYDREVSLWDELSWRLKKKVVEIRLVGVNPTISGKRMADNHLKAIYEFYYRNLVVVFRNMNQPEEKEERNKIYLILYEFMEELTELYRTIHEEEEYSDSDKEESGLNYSMAVCGMINAVMDSDSEDSEHFCNYVFNNILSEKIWQFQICLYILFQEFLYRTNTEAISLDNLRGINDLKQWEISNLSFKEIEMCGEFWKIWAESTTLSEDVGYRYFFRAFGTLSGEFNTPGPIMYFTQVLKHIKE